MGSNERESSQARSELQHSLDVTKQELEAATGLADSQRGEIEQVQRWEERNGEVGVKEAATMPDMEGRG